MIDDPQLGILNPGDVLNNTYVVAELVASGGTGEVYRATNRVSGREIAVKILKAEFAKDEQFTNLMKREASVLHEVIDDCVVRYYDLLESDLHGGFLFIVMEFIHGPSLAENMRTAGPVDADVLLKVAERVLLGLMAAHEKNAFHRDLSPDNVILRDGDPAQSTLIDFGIAKDVNEGAKTVVGGGFAGKYQYAAPEQMEGNADARSDLYSLGMTLVGAYRGQSPSKGSSLMEIISAKAIKPDISDMTGQLHDLVSRLVEPDPNNRFQTAADALKFLQPGTAAPLSTPPDDEKTVVLQKGAVLSPIVKPGSSPPAPAPPSTEGTIEALQREIEEPEKSRTGVWLALLVLVVAGVGGGVWFSGILSPTPDPITPDVKIVTDPALPVADPYVLSVERTSKNDPLALRGNLPSAEAIPKITTQLEEQLDTFAVLAEVTPADGVPLDGWAEKIVQIAVIFDQIDAWKVSASGTSVTLTAKAQNPAEKVALLNATEAVLQGSGMTIIDEIAIIVASVDLAGLKAALQSLQSCGPLQLTGGSGGAVAPDDTLSVAGNLANATEISRIQAMLSEAAPGRPVTNSMTVLNNSVCQAMAQLPSGSQADNLTSAFYRNSVDDQLAPGSAYHLGDNPVIDIVLPTAIEGFLSVIFVSLDEQVFHLLPHQARDQNKLSDIGSTDGDSRIVRVAFPVAEASIEKLGFKVVEPLGANLLIAVVTPERLFDDLRPRAESTSAFVEALAGRVKDFQSNSDTHIVAYRPLITKP